eukprot:TRINITY_DN19872_c0_g1_i1.p1 TRINITY_DN19872_c0_g1~~TRINITY_DN19872_c0_g1_i1.p1  ORF type:complete len:117 (-),score=12.72 TRINITY_DN19872_c0_g1_i1:414-764(-)
MSCLAVYSSTFFFLIIRRPPRSTQSRSSAASDVYKRQLRHHPLHHVRSTLTTQPKREMAILGSVSTLVKITKMIKKSHPNGHSLSSMTSRLPQTILARQLAGSLVCWRSSAFNIGL